MTAEDVQHCIHTFIAERLLEGDADGLDRATPLLELGVLHSMGVTELTVFLEKEFRLTVAPEELSAVNFASIDALTRMVLRLADRG
jgi:acyl carrier protein